MRLAIGLDGDLIEATESGVARCPECGDELIAKALDSQWIRCHWAHIADTGCTYEGGPLDTDNPGPWHRQWQRWAKSKGARIEVNYRKREERRRADIVLPDGMVVEVQQSAISDTSITARNRFHRGEVAWLFDASAWARAKVRNSDGERIPAINWLKMTKDAPDPFSSGRIELVGQRFSWRRARKAQTLAGPWTFWDVGDGVWWVDLRSTWREPDMDGKGYWSTGGYLRGKWGRDEWLNLLFDGRWSRRG